MHVFTFFDIYSNNALKLSPSTRALTNENYGGAYVCLKNQVYFNKRVMYI